MYAVYLASSKFLADSDSGNKLEGDWGEIVALGAEISPLKEPREKWSLPKKKKKKKKKNFFFFFFF